MLDSYAAPITANLRYDLPCWHLAVVQFVNLYVGTRAWPALRISIRQGAVPYAASFLGMRPLKEVVEGPTGQSSML